MLKNNQIALFISIAAVAFAGTTVPGGNVSGTWNVQGSPYYIQGDITIPLGSTLTIEPGVQAIFQGNYSLTVNGYIDASGTVDDSIYFTKEMPGPGWEGIRFIDAPGTSHLYYCAIEYGNASGSLPNNLGGGIYIRNSDPVVSHCRFSNNTASFGGAIYAIASNPVIECCLMNDNVASNYGGAMHLFGSDASITNCTITQNQGAGGGGLYIDFCQPVIVNTIVADNLGFGGIYFLDAPNTEVRYSDFHDNEYGAFTGYVPSGLGSIVGTNANGDPCDTHYNIFLDPQFVNSPAGDFRIHGTSPCVDAGDPTSSLDPDSTIADIGVYYFDQLGIVHSDTLDPYLALDLSVYPNPSVSESMISFALPNSQYLTLTLYDSSGRCIATLAEGTLEAGKHEYSIERDDLSSGLYYCRLKTEAFSVTGKLLIMK